MTRSVSISEAIVPMQHPLALVRTAEEQGAVWKELLAGTGLDEELLHSPEAKISYGTFGILVANALGATQNPSLGLDFGRRVHLGNLGVLGLALLTSANAGAALEVALQYYRVLAPGWEISLAVDGSNAVLTATPAVDYGPMLPFATEALLVAVEGQARFLLGGPAPVVRVELGYEAPPYQARYAEIAGCPIVFGEATTRVIFEASILDAPLRWADPIAARDASRRCADLLAELDKAEGLVGRVHKLLSASMMGYPTEVAIARELQTSPRTLRRGLSQLGTSYQTLLDEHRHKQALMLLRTTRLPAETIATRLGFADVRSFRRAFKRWTGQIPSAFRAS
jgi:AraC-like DNA-binding protein